MKRKIAKSLLAVAFTMGMSMFAYNATASEKASHPHWAYDGEHGPAHWGHMSEEFAACSQGKTQSPIDISGASEEDTADIAFSYKPSKLNILNNGHTVQVNYDKGSSIKVDGVDFQLVQFHFHTPSEHTVGGKSFGQELHLVHKNDKGELAVVGVLIEKGKENAAYKKIWSNLPRKADEKKEVNAEINAEELLPKTRAAFRYTGSLTTPPCSEGVNWIVLKSPIQMSAKQIDSIQKIMHRNNRPVQPIQGRKVTSDTVSH